MGRTRGLKPSFLLLAAMAVLAILVTNLSFSNVSFASGPTPILAVITISKDAQGNTVYSSFITFANMKELTHVTLHYFNIKSLKTGDSNTEYCYSCYFTRPLKMNLQFSSLMVINCVS